MAISAALLGSLSFEKRKEFFKRLIILPSKLTMTEQVFILLEIVVSSLESGARCLLRLKIWF